MSDANLFSSPDDYKLQIHFNVFEHRLPTGNVTVALESVNAIFSEIEKHFSSIRTPNNHSC